MPKPLFAVASIFERSGDASSMTRPRGGGPMQRWDNDLATAQAENVPSFAPGWNEHGDFVTDAVKRLEVIKNGLAASPDPHTRGLLMVKKAVTMSGLGDTDVAVGILQQLAGSTRSLSTRTVAEFALARLSSKPSG